MSFYVILSANLLMMFISIIWLWMGNNERKRLERIKDEKMLMKRTVYRTYALQKLIPADKRSGLYCREDKLVLEIGFCIQCTHLPMLKAFKTGFNICESHFRPINRIMIIPNNVQPSPHVFNRPSRDLSRYVWKCSLTHKFNTPMTHRL